MTASVLIAHCPEDTELAEQVAAALQTLSAQTTVACSALRDDQGSADARVRLAACETLIALLTPRAVGGQDVLLQLGAAWALGDRLVLLLDRALSPAQRLPPLPAQRVMLEPETLIELAHTLAGPHAGREHIGPAAKLVLSELFPGWSPSRESSEHPIARSEATATQTLDLSPVEPAREPAHEAAPPRAVAVDLPRASTSLDAGRTLADAVFESDEQQADPDALDVPFGAFLASLGGNWSSLREIGDPDVWREATENLLEALPPEGQPTRGWYEVGYHAALLLQLARRQLELDRPEDTLERRWQDAWSALREGAWRAGLPQTIVDELHAMLDNLRGPLRDYANLGRAQARVHELASQAD